MFRGDSLIRLAGVHACKPGTAHIISAAHAFVHLSAVHKRSRNGTLQVVAESAMSIGNVPDHPAARILQEEVSESSADVPKRVTARQFSEAAHIPEAGVARLDTGLHATLLTIEALPLHRRVYVRQFRFKDGTLWWLERPR